VAAAAGLGFENRVLKKSKPNYLDPKDLIFNRDFTFRLMASKERLAVLRQGERDNVS
jgi:hypothetical protein